MELACVGVATLDTEIDTSADRKTNRKRVHSRAWHKEDDRLKKMGFSLDERAMQRPAYVSTVMQKFDEENPK